MTFDISSSSNLCGNARHTYTCKTIDDVTPKSKINLTIRQKEEFKEHYDENNVIIMLNILVQNGIFFKLDQRLVGSTIYF